MEEAKAAPLNVPLIAGATMLVAGAAALAVGPPIWAIGRRRERAFLTASAGGMTLRF
jgi:hypothetical protein